MSIFLLFRECNVSAYRLHPAHPRDELLSMRDFQRASLNNQRGGFLVLGAIFVALLFGFAALGIEMGRWYAVKTEIAKAVDAASLAGAVHLTNPNITDKELFIRQVAEANFHNGILGTDHQTTFTVTSDPHTSKVIINGQANVLNTISRGLSYAGDSVPVSAFGAAKLGGAEIVLVTDVSGSMSGQPLTDLVSAANQFIDNFEDTEDRNLFGLVSYASGAVVDVALKKDFHYDMAIAIDALASRPENGGTNTLAGLANAGSSVGFTEYTTEPLDDRRDQYVIFISDGQPTAFTAQFTHNDNDFSAVVQSYTNTHNLVEWALWEPDAINTQYQGGSIDPLPRGDGLPTGQSSCSGPATTKWWILADATYGPSSLTNYYASLAGGDPEDCANDPDIADTGGYVIQTAKKMALAEAALLKAKGVVIYAIGFGTVNPAFLDEISSGPNYSFPVADSSDLEGILQVIANRLKLRLLK